MRVSCGIHRSVFLAGFLAVVSGCGGGLGNLGTLGEILAGAATPGGSQQGRVAAEIQQIDARQQAIQIRTEDGRTGAVRYDQNTEVVYQQQRYPVDALERGDVVVMQVQQDAQGNAYVSRIDVQQSVQERTGQSSGGTAQLQQIGGQIRQIDHDRGLFELQTQSGGVVTVSLPYNAAQATVQYFNRLRTGDAVSLEGTVIGSGRIELYRFL